MFILSEDPDIAQEQMSGLIFYLTTFGYIDGEFDPSEMKFIEDVIRKVVIYRVDHSPAKDDARERTELIELYTGYFNQMFAICREDVTALMNESIAEAESRQTFVTSKLKQRCFEIFQTFSPENQQSLIETVDELLMADGVAHPAELALRKELIELLEIKPEPPVDLKAVPRTTTVAELDANPHEGRNHPFLDPLERSYVQCESFIEDQLAFDQSLIDTARYHLHQQRQAGKGKLKGKESIEELADEEPFMDGRVCVLPLKPDRNYEITVLGDLHGCYSCLKGAMMQSRFLDRLEAFRKDPGLPEPKLVFLGDYLDRGRYGFDGVLRAALRIFNEAPEHVYLLRGNHEFLVEHEGEIHSMVRPAEAIESLRPYAPISMLEAYQALFDNLPIALFVGRILFAHGGIPSDGRIKEVYTDLSSLNIPKLWVQMLWSDPSVADVIPRALQEQSYRFGFGKLQAQAFLHRLGCHTLIRGHQVINEGMREHYDEEDLSVITLFSAGGKHNPDLLAQSRYRKIRPMAMTVETQGGTDGPAVIEAWPIEYEPYITEERNGFYGPILTRADE